MNQLFLDAPRVNLVTVDGVSKIEIDVDATPTELENLVVSFREAGVSDRFHRSSISAGPLLRLPRLGWRTWGELP